MGAFATFFSPQNSKPWICIGDFNEILDNSEKDGGKDGGNQRPASLMNDFRDALFDTGLQDIGVHGDWYTWVRRWSDVRERLDCSVCSLAWMSRLL